MSKVIDSMWFNTAQGSFGIILAEDETTGERKLYAGAAAGFNQQADERAILSWGNKVNIGLLEGLIRKTGKKPLLQAQCDAWNKEYPIGTEVILTDDLGEKHLTKTRSEAQLLSGHTPVIWTELKACYLLTRIQPRKCRVCGCTTEQGCLIEGKEDEDIMAICHWVEIDLCSACV